VTAFLVDHSLDHSPVTPALGYRIDYRGRSVAISGDTKPSDNLVKSASVLIC
jgi:ribonuclease Z